MKIVVTGGAGFIGSHLVDALTKLGHRVLVIDSLVHGKLSNIAASLSKYDFKKIDICSPKLERIFKTFKPQIVFHLAAQTSVPVSLKNPSLDSAVNIGGSVNVFQSALKVKVNKVIFTSTGGALYGEALVRPTPETYPATPLSPYGIAKLAAENYLRYFNLTHKLKHTILRFSNVYGPRQDPRGEAGVIAIFADKILRNESPSINGTGQQTRDYVYVGDVVTALIKSMSPKVAGFYNIATQKETSVIELVTKINKLSKKNITPLHRPVIKGEVYRSVLNSNKAKKNLGWKARVNIDQGLKLVIQSLKDK